MELMNSRWLRWYFPVFNFVAQDRLKKNDIDRRDIHTHLAIVLTTSILMWGYAFVAWYTIASPVPGVVGFICSAIHLLSPLYFRFSNNTYVAINIPLTAGIVHQGTFSYFSGGFDSNILIWFGILPMIGGLVCGFRGAMTWFFATVFFSLLFFLMHLNDYRFPYLISHEGRIWSQAMLVFGWIFLSSIIIIVYSGLRQNTEKLLHEQSRKIEDLFRVLFHDLANPLGRIAIGLSIARRSLPDNEPNRGFEIAKNASDSMMEITQNVRKMYAVSKGKAHMDLSLVSLNDAVAYIQKVYAPELERKNIKLSYHFDKNQGLHLLVEPVSFNNQVLGNAISNAIKFSPEGSEIFLAVYPHGEDLYTLEVRDNGIGIPKVMIDQLFDINKKTTRPGTKGEQGTGFGMHIMKSFVELYGGRIHVDSLEAQDDLPSGTTVKIFLKGKWT
jgi:signal transduction histidine kinase